MNKIKENQLTIVLTLVAFIFSMAVRLIWVYHFDSMEQYKFNNEFMINTNDGYYFAEGARDILSGISQDNDLSPIDNSLSKLTAIIVQITPFPFESVIFYLSAVLSSLIVVPLVLIGKAFQKVEVGFVAALLASVAVSYYNRTMVGYYDTDMLNIVFPVLLIWSLIFAIRTKENKYILFTGIEIVLYRFWYPQSYSLEFAFFILILLYIVFLWYKKVDFKFELKLLIVILFAMCNLPEWIRLAIVFFIYFTKDTFFSKYIYYTFVFSMITFFLTGGIDPIYHQLKQYVFRDTVVSSSVTEGLSLHFFTVMQTIKEAGKISFETFAHRISGSTIGLILGLIGYLIFIYKNHAMLLGLPLLGLGLLAYGIPGLVQAGGLRFTIYAVPIIALGLGFMIYEVSRFLSQQLINDYAKVASKYVLMTLFTAAFLYPNLKHVQEYKIPTVLFNQEAKILDTLKSIAQREDYVVAWWDYGYPIRYYSDVKTLIDGGKHSGSTNFPVSFIFSNHELVASKMARLEVEYTEKSFQSTSQEWASSNLEQMIKEYNFKSSDEFLNALPHISLPQKTRDIYLYMPYKMFDIYNTIQKFSNIDLATGKVKDQSFFYQTQSFTKNGDIYDLGSNILLDTKTSTLNIQNETIPLSTFSLVEYDNKSQLKKQVIIVNPNANLHVIYMKSYKKFFVMDSKTFASTFIQFFVFENYDKTLYEPVVLNPLIKIYKQKI